MVSESHPEHIPLLKEHARNAAHALRQMKNLIPSHDPAADALFTAARELATVQDFIDRLERRAHRADTASDKSPARIKVG